MEICQHRVTYRNIRVLRDYTSSSLALSVLWVLPALHSWQCPNCAYHESKLLGAFQSSRLMTRPSGATKNFSNHVVRGGGQTHRKCLISWRPTLIETKNLKRVGGPSCPRPSCLPPRPVDPLDLLDFLRHFVKFQLLCHERNPEGQNQGARLFPKVTDQDNMNSELCRIFQGGDHSAE